MKNIKYINLSNQWIEERDDLLREIDKVLKSGEYIGGEAVDLFEKKTAQLCGVKHSIALNSGTDALIFGLASLGIKPGDEVITPPNSFIASTAAIVHIGAKPIFVDVAEDQNIDVNKIESLITKNTKAIMPVHLTGRMAEMDKLNLISEKYNIPVIEDAAQAIGSKYKMKPSGSWGKVACFSTHPLKNLNACGDGGFLVTDDDLIADNLRCIRNHGLISRGNSKRFGFVSRMDALQATILNYRIKKLDQVVNKRRYNASLYYKHLDQSRVFFPKKNIDLYNTYHTFVIQVEERDKLKDSLLQFGIETAIHYPIPIHLQPAACKLGYKKGDFPITESQSRKILTLPVNQFLTEDEILYICEHVNKLSIII